MTQNFTDVDLQISVFEAEDLTVIGIYRSQQDTNITMLLGHLIPAVGNVLIIGDMNICSRSESKHSAFQLLRRKGFENQISEATHFGGGALDQAWLRTTTDTHYVSNTDIYSPFYNSKDHDVLYLHVQCRPW